ncbi:MAG: TolC family protein [Lacipirellulaceae bacterium]
MPRLAKSIPATFVAIPAGMVALCLILTSPARAAAVEGISGLELRQPFGPGLIRRLPPVELESPTAERVETPSPATETPRVAMAIVDPLIADGGAPAAAAEAEGLMLGPAHGSAHGPAYSSVGAKESLESPELESPAPAPADPRLAMPEVLPTELDGDEATAEAPLPSVAPAVAEPAVRLTLREAVRLGMANNRDVAVAKVTPAIDATNIDTERAAFDPLAGLSIYGGQADRQARSLVQTFGEFADAIETDFFLPLDRRNMASVQQRFRSGGVVELGLSTDYQRLQPEGPQLLVNPGWDSVANVRLSQPLARGRGRGVNEAPLRIAQAGARRSQHEFCAELRRAVFEIDQAYWRLAGAQQRVAVAKDFLAKARAFDTQEEERRKLGLSARPELLQTGVIVRTAITTAGLADRDTRIAEVRLRRSMGLAMAGLGLADPTDGVLPIEAMLLEAFPADSDMNETTDVALAVPIALRRPELEAQRARIDAVEQAIIAARNGLQPDLRAQLDYATTGLDERLSGSFDTLGRNEYSTWAAGVAWERRLGLRSEQADLRRAQLLLAREAARERQVAHDIVASLREAAAAVETLRDLLDDRIDLVKSTRQQLEVFDELYNENETSLFQRIEILRVLAAAELDVVTTWTDLQLALAEWRYQRGDNCARFGIEVGED